MADDRIEDFIKSWENAFGVRLTKEKAVARAHELVELYRELSQGKPHKEDDVTPPPTAEGL